jgi:hypothetical protein
MWGMSEPYNRFTGQSLERLTALSDGLFAVAMTLLVLDLRVPSPPRGADLPHQHPGERDRAVGRPAVLHRLPRLQRAGRQRPGGTAAT